MILKQFLVIALSAIGILTACSDAGTHEITSQTSNEPELLTAKEIQLLPEYPSQQDSILLTIDESVYFNDVIKEITLDATAFGIEAPITMDESLNEISFGIDDQLSPGEKTLVLAVTDQNNHTEQIEKTITVVAKEEKDSPLAFDWDEARIYFALTDRFYNGDPSNDNPFDDVIDLDHLETYHGGDFQGLIDKIPYLQELGINTLWITPIVDNIDWNVRAGVNDKQYGYHGYWAKDFTQLDEHLGDLATFHQLIETAHDHGIKLMVDVVLNHTGYGMKITDGDQSIANFPTKEEQMVFDGLIRTDPVANHQIVGELSGLPDLQTEEADVRQQIIEWQTDWLEKAQTIRGDTIDFYRVDTVKHVEDTTWKAFKNELVKVKSDFKLIGEDYGASIDKNGGYLNDGEMDSLLDFEFKQIAGSFVNWDVMGAQEKLIDRNNKLTSDATMGQFLSSHDEDGFLYKQAGGDLGKQMVAASLMITAKGQPVIYYGEEIGLTGAAAKNMDNGEYSENRYDFDWEASEGSGSQVYNHYKTLLNIRKDYSKLFAKGNRETIAGSNDEGYLVFSRSYQDEQVVIALNIFDQEKEVTIELPFSTSSQVIDRYSGKSYTIPSDRKLTLTLPPRSLGGTVVIIME